MRGISITDILMYIIATVVIVGFAFYLALFLNVTASVSLSSEDYLLFLNSLYLSRINYCMYLATNDSNYLFYFVKDMNVSSSKEISNYLKDCFSRVISNVSILVGNYSTKSDEDLKRLSEYVCMYEDPNFIADIKSAYKDSVILIYQPKQISTVPVFAYINISNYSKIGWIMEPAIFLLEQEGYSGDIIFKILGGISNIIVPGTSSIWKNIEDYIRNKIIEGIRKNAENSINCKVGNGYSILPMFSIQTMVVDTQRNLYVLSVHQFSMVKNLGEETALIVDNNGNIKNVTISELARACTYVNIPAP